LRSVKFLLTELQVLYKAVSATVKVASQYFEIYSVKKTKNTGVMFLITF